MHSGSEGKTETDAAVEKPVKYYETGAISVKIHNWVSSPTPFLNAALSLPVAIFQKPG